MKKKEFCGEFLAVKVNQMLGHKFALPKTEDGHVCFYCEFEGDHIVTHRMVDLDNAIKTYRCTKCNQIWEYGE